MALNEMFNQVKQRVKAVYDNFFYSGNGQEAPAPRIQDDYTGGQADPYAQQRRGGAPGYGAPQQGGYQQPYTQPAGAPQGGHRTRRAQRNSPDNVVDFGAYQHAQAQQQYAAAGQQFAAQSTAYAQSQSQPQHYQQAAAQQQGATQPQSAPQPQNPEAPASGTVCARIINARGMGDCRSAITLLRKGDSVLIVLESITDPTEMRRLVDTLSGACYSLTATITKVSRYGVYLLAPQTLPVYADQATSLMNNPSARSQGRNYQGYAQPQRGGYMPQAGYGAPAYQPGQPNPYMNPNQQPSQAAPAFTQRAPLPEEAPQNFYQRPTPQEAQTPAFSAQPVSYGYAPDESRAAEQ